LYTKIPRRVDFRRAALRGGNRLTAERSDGSRLNLGYNAKTCQIITGDASLKVVVMRKLSKQ
jgi:hypothetical protein